VNDVGLSVGRHHDDPSTDLWDTLSTRSGHSDEDDDSFFERLEDQLEKPAFERMQGGLGDDAGSECAGGSEDRESVTPAPVPDRLVMRGLFWGGNCLLSDLG